jgi:hypothetical protein
MLSLPKILLTIAIIVVVIYGAKLLRRRGDNLVRKSERKAAAKAEKRGSVELDKCPVCEIFVGTDSRPCERPDCPYPS